jgi:hypothetical protein
MEYHLPPFSDTSFGFIQQSHESWVLTDKQHCCAVLSTMTPKRPCIWIMQIKHSDTDVMCPAPTLY